jgi:hypothetical protein
MRTLLRKCIDALLWRARIERDFWLGVLKVIYRSATTVDRVGPMWVLRGLLLVLFVLLLNVALNKLRALLALPALPF